MRLRLRVLVLSSLVAGSTLAARASTATFGFNFSGSGQTGSGQLTASTTGTAGTYLITGISGTTDGLTITSLLVPGSYPKGFAGDVPNDNLLFFPGNANTYFDFAGLSYVLSDGTDVNVFENGGPRILFGTNETNLALTTLSITASTPEPSTLTLLGSGLVGVVGVFRRKRTL